MKVRTKYHGEVELTIKDIWHFDSGIPGFPDEKEFIILPLLDNQVFSILQSSKSAEIAFVITDPFSFFKTYEFIIDDQSLEQLGLHKEKDALVSVILTVQDPFERTTANLQAPVIFNIKNKKAKQFIINDSQYITKYPLFENKGVN